MSNEHAFTPEDASAFLQGVIELGGAEYVDDTPDKFIHLLNDPQPIELTVDGEKKKAVLYGSASQTGDNTVLINPYAEGAASATQTTWFYLSRNQILGTCIGKLIHNVLEFTAKRNAVNTKVAEGLKKKTKTKDKDALDPKVSAAILALLAEDANEVDEKMVKEFDTITADRSQFFTIYYNQTKDMGMVSCIIFNEKQRAAYKSVRTKTWSVLTRTICRLFDCTDLSVFNYKPSTLSCKVLESFINILVNVYRKLSEFWSQLQEEFNLHDIKIENLNYLENHLGDLPMYQRRGRILVAPEVTSSSAGAVPWSVPSGAAPVATAPTVGGVSVFSGNAQAQAATVGAMAPSGAMGFCAPAPVAPSYAAPMGVSAPMAPMAPMGAVPMAPQPVYTAPASASGFVAPGGARTTNFW